MKRHSIDLTLVSLLALGLAIAPVAQDTTIDEDSEDGETVFVQVLVPANLPNPIA